MLERFQVESRRETQQDATVNLLNGKDVLVLQPKGSGKSIIFQSFPLIVDKLRKSVRSTPVILFLLFKDGAYYC